MSLDQQSGSNWPEILLAGFKFVANHILGLLSIMFGVVTKVYIIRKDIKRISKWQCRLSVFISGLSGTITYLIVQDLDITIKYKAILTGFIPIIVEPVVMRILVWVNPLIDAIGKTATKKINDGKNT